VDSVLPKLFSGGKDLAKLRLNLYLHFVRPQKGVWGMNAGGLLDFWRGQFGYTKRPEKAMI
jgi:hypothetical protein